MAISIAALATIAGLALIVTQFSDISAFARQARDARPVYVGLAGSMQLTTYACVAFVWRRVLSQAGYPISLAKLYPLSVAKLFADQAAPSAGVSGAIFFLHALGRRGVPRETAFAVFIFATVSFFAAFICAAMISLFALARADSAPSALVSSIAGFAGIILLMFVLIYAGFVLRLGLPTALINRFGFLRRAMDWLHTAGSYIEARRALFFEATAVQFCVRMIDGATLSLLFIAIGAPEPYSACFFAVVMASVAATIGPMPMGLGTFEAGMLATLGVFGVPLESALTTTVLYRGLTLWAPLLPGFYIIQREILSRSIDRPPEIDSV